MTEMARGSDSKISMVRPSHRPGWACRVHPTRQGWVSRQDPVTGVVYYLCRECYQAEQDELAAVYIAEPGSGPQPRQLTRAAGEGSG